MYSRNPSFTLEFKTDEEKAKEAAEKALLTRAIILCYKLVNTVYSASFEKSLTKPLTLHTDFQCDNGVLFADKSQRNYKSSFKNFVKESSSKEDLTSYLEAIEKHFKIPLKASDRKGQMKTLSSTESYEIQQLIFKLTPLKRVYQFQRISFDFGEIIYEAKLYILTRTCWLNGLENKDFHRIFKHLLLSEPKKYFEQGYPVDVFDSVQIDISVHKNRYISILKSWLNIWCFRSDKNLEPHEIELATGRTNMLIP